MVVTFFDALALEAQQSWTVYIVLITLGTWVVTRVAAVNRPRLKGMVFFAGIHVLAVVIAAALTSLGSPHAEEFRTPGWMIGAIAMVGALGTMLFSVLLPRLKISTPLIVQDVVVAIAGVVVAVTVASRANVNLSGLIATSAVFTAMLGFSLQDVIGNVAGGLALQVDNSLEEGDWVKVNDVTGRVVQIRWRHTAIETRNWETVLVPNSVLMKSQVTVLGRRTGKPQLWRRWVYFNVDWKHQPSDVMTLVSNAVRSAKLERVAKDPAPNCVLMDMTESYGKYAVRYWLTDLAVDDPTDSEVRTCIYFALQRADMRIAVATHAIEMHPDHTAEKNAKALHRREHLLQRLELFAPLSEAERTSLAEQLKYSPFTTGDVMTRQGSDAHWLYLIEEGRASVRVVDGDLEKEVACMNGPDIFGEMSLLTGSPRSATVVALSDVECFRLDKGALQSILDARPELAKQFAELLARRQVDLVAAKEGLDAEAARVRAASTATDLLSRITNFFRLN